MNIRRYALLALLAGCGHIPNKPTPAPAASAETRPYFFAPEEDNGWEQVDPSFLVFQTPEIHLVEFPDAGLESL